MSFRFIQALPAGNAVEIGLAPPAGAASWRVQRNTTGVFTGPSTTGAAVVADDWGDTGLVDILGLTNGTPYHYRVDYRDAAGTWLAGATGSDTAVATPMATFGGAPPDPQTLLRDRLDAGLAVEVLRGALRASPRTGRIEVLMAPFALSDNLAFPVVSVHLESSVPSVRGTGETLALDRRLSTGDWRETAGWLSRVSLNVVAVTLNPGERAALRQAVARVVQINLPVFDAQGLLLVEFQQRDYEDAEAYSAPLYFSLGIFSCLAPVFAEGDRPDVATVTVTPSEPT